MYLVMRTKIKPAVFHGYPYKIGVEQRETLFEIAKADGNIEVSELVRYCIDEGIASIKRYGGLRKLMLQREIEKQGQNVQARAPKEKAVDEDGKKESGSSSKKRKLG